MRSALSLLLLLMITLNLSAHDLCDHLARGEFDEVEKMVKKQVRRFKKPIQAEYRQTPDARMDSLEVWLQSFDCVKDAYWDRSLFFLDWTEHYIHSVAVIFQLRDSTFEQCFSIQTGYINYWHFWRWTFALGGNSKLKYRQRYSCPGYLQKMKDIDSTNEANYRIGWHNAAISLQMKLVKSGYPHPEYFGNEPIQVELRISNRTDTNIRVIWPIQQNHGQKHLYFELLDENGHRLYLEDRQVILPHSETIPYDLLKLKPHETKIFIHTINGRCTNTQQRIECHHEMGEADRSPGGLSIPKGSYRLRTWYSPPDTPDRPKIWRPMGLDSLFFRTEMGNDYLEITVNEVAPDLRSEWFLEDSLDADLIAEVKIIEGPDNNSRDSEPLYHAMARVMSLEKGELKKGTIITLRFPTYPSSEEIWHRPLLNEEIYQYEIANGKYSSFRIMARDLKTGTEGIAFELIRAPNAIIKLVR